MVVESSSPFESLTPLTALSTVEQSVYNCLKEAIITGKLAPGLKLVTAKIAEKLGVSRMPVREAIRRLAIEGFVTNMPHRGAVVTELSSLDVEEIYNIRIVLEGYAMKLAIERVTNQDIANLEQLLNDTKEQVKNPDFDKIQVLDDKFHRALFAICGSERLNSLLTNLWDQSIFFRSVAALLRKDLSLSISHHEELIEALRARDAKRSVKAIQAHTSVSRDTLVKYLQEREA